MIASRKPEHLEAGHEAVAALGAPVTTVSCDIRDPEQISAAFDAATEAYGLPGVLINNAAANFPVPAEDMSPNAWRTVVDITLNGTFFCSREFARRHLEAGTPGSIVNVGASYAWTGGPGFAHSAAAKAGVKNMTETLAVEWGPYGIQVNGLVPGPVPARRHDRRHQGQPRPHHGEGRRAACAARRAGPRARLGGDVPGVAVRAVHLRVTRSWSTAPTGNAACSPTHRSSPCASRWARVRSSLDRRSMIVDTHVHVVAGDESRHPLRPSGVGSQWFRDHPVTVEQYLDDRDRRRRRRRGARPGARRVRERQLVRARCAAGRPGAHGGSRDRRSRRSRPRGAVARAGGGAGMSRRPAVRHRSRATDVVRRRRRCRAVGHRDRSRPADRGHAPRARPAPVGRDVVAAPGRAGRARPLRFPRPARRSVVPGFGAGARAGRPAGAPPEGHVARPRGSGT